LIEIAPLSPEEKMTPKELESILSILTVMKEYELTAAKLYHACKEIWIVDEAFWAEMEREEMKHSGNIDRMIERISKNPERFELGQPFKLPAVRTSIDGVKWNMERLKKKEITKERMLFVCRDLEQTMIESRYAEIVKTSDDTFQSLVNEIVSDTLSHHDRLDKRMKGKD
jgi:rubrerythrin